VHCFLLLREASSASARHACILILSFQTPAVVTASIPAAISITNDYLRYIFCKERSALHWQSQAKAALDELKSAEKGKRVAS
jgi:hypothetical protein